MSGFPVTGLGGWGDDFQTQMMMQQLANGGYSAVGGGRATGNSGGAAAPAKQGMSLGTGALVTTAGAGATYAGMNWLNHSFNSPVEEVKGKLRFTDDFMHHFSNEYHAVENEAARKTFFSNLSQEVSGKAKFTVNAENFAALDDELRAFLSDPSNPKVADMSADLKSFLNQRLGKDIVPSGTTITDANRHFYEVVDGDLAAIRGKYAEMFHGAQGLEFANNYTLQKSILESYDNVIKGMDSCTTAAAKAEYLRSNAHTFGLSAADWERVFSGTESEINAVFDAAKNNTTRKAAIQSSFTALEDTMHGFARNWDKEAGLFTKGKFTNIFSKAKVGALENALSSFRRVKGGRFALVGAAATAVGCLLYNA